jgi:uncharacterized protein YukE
MSTLLVLLTGGGATNPVDAGAQIVQSGILGAIFVFIVVPLGLYVKHLTKQLKTSTDDYTKALKDIQEKRVADGKEVSKELLKTSEQWNGTLSEHVRTLETLEATLRDVKDALREVREELRERPTRR